MAARGSDSDEDLVSYGTGLEPLEEGAGQISRRAYGKQSGGSSMRRKAAQLCVGPSLVLGKGLAGHGVWEQPRERRALSGCSRSGGTDERPRGMGNREMKIRARVRVGNGVGWLGNTSLRKGGLSSALEQKGTMHTKIWGEERFRQSKQQVQSLRSRRQFGKLRDRQGWCWWSR